MARRKILIAVLIATELLASAAVAARIVAVRVSGRRTPGNAEVRNEFGVDMRVVRGDYLVLFDPDFGCRPVVTVTAQGTDDGKPLVGTITDLDDDRVRVRFRNPASGDVVDPRELHLIGIGCD